MKEQRRLHLAPGRAHGRPGPAQHHRPIPLLAERGINLSRPQVYRLVNQRPERVSLQVIAAICDIFDCGPGDLLTVTAADVRARKTGTATPPNVVELDRTVRPRRANILDE